jgi:glycyl-tRNA synthetase
MVVEMTSLQGEIGRIYALQSGEPPEVAEAIFEHYLPRGPEDRLPESQAGVLVGLADRLDTLMGLFATGYQPSGTRDPYALRRTAIGLIQLLVGREVGFDLRAGVAHAAEFLPLDIPAEIMQNCLEFLVSRLQALLISEGYAYDAVEAVLAAQGHDPYRAGHALDSLERWRERSDWDELLQAYARCARIIRGETEDYAVAVKRMVEPAEKELWEALLSAEAEPQAPGSVDDFFHHFQPLVPAITKFFDDVLVMVEDPALRSNRLGILQRIVALADGIVDLSKLEGF